MNDKITYTINLIKLTNITLTIFWDAVAIYFGFEFYDNILPTLIGKATPREILTAAFYIAATILAFVFSLIRHARYITICDIESELLKEGSKEDGTN